MKNIYFIFTAILLSNGARAQQQDIDTHQFSIGLSSNHNYNHVRWGVSGFFKWQLPSRVVEGHRVVFTAKATHSPSTDGGHFFHGFDRGNYNNISAVHLLGGYRFHFWDKNRHAGPLLHPRRRAWYLELSAGGTYIGYDHSVAAAVSPVIGYSFAETFDLLIGYHGSFGKRDINLAELGAAFSF